MTIFIVEEKNVSRTPGEMAEIFLWKFSLGQAVYAGTFSPGRRGWYICELNSSPAQSCSLVQLPRSLAGCSR